MNKRELMIEIGLKMFAEEGYESTGVAAIVDRAEVTKPTLYHYFGNKEGLLRSIYETYFIPFISNLRMIHFDEQDIMQSVFLIFEAYLKQSQSNEAFFWLMNHLRKAPLKSESHHIVLPYNEEEQRFLLNTMEKISRIHPNLVGQELFLTYNFLSLINGFIEIHMMNKTLSDCSTNDILRLTKQFLYGIYSL